MGTILMWTGLFLIVGLPKLLTFFVGLPDFTAIGALVFFVGVIIAWYDYSRGRGRV